MRDEDWERDPLTEGERTRVALRFRIAQGPHAAVREDEECSVVGWAARMKLGYVLSRAVMAGLVQIDMQMGDIRLTASQAVLDRLIAEAREDIFPQFT